MKIKAISVNPLEWHVMRGKPFFARFSIGLFKPNNKILGSDFAGIVEAVGKHITKFKIGDEVFGEAFAGSFGEYNCVKLHMLAHKPENASFEEAACLGVAGLTALKGIRDHGKLLAAEKVLIAYHSDFLSISMACPEGSKYLGQEISRLLFVPG